jgi:hypothetical protein
LILTQNRSLTADGYARLVGVFAGPFTPICLAHIFSVRGMWRRWLICKAGTTVKALQVKCSKFRVEQRDLYAQLGWELGDSGVGGKRKSGKGGEGEGTPKKKGRGKNDSGSGGSGEETPVKKSRAKKATIVEKSEDNEEEMGAGVGAKMEMQDSELETDNEIYTLKSAEG